MFKDIIGTANINGSHQIPLIIFIFDSINSFREQKGEQG